jgi:hypothetical protein
LYLLAVVHSDAATEATVPTVTSTTGLTFVQVGSSMPFDTIAANIHRLTLFRALKSSGLSAGTYTVNFGDAATGCAAQLVEVSDVLTTGVDGANAVRNITTGSANAGANPSVTMGAFLQAYNSAYVCFGLDTAVIPTVGAGFSSLGVETYATPTTTLYAQHRANGIGTTANCTATSSDWAAIAIELVARTATTALEWISPRIKDGFVATNAADVLGGIWASESVATANAGLKVDLIKRAPDGTESAFYTRSDGAELPTGGFLNKLISGGTLTPDVRFGEDDRLVVRCVAVNVGTMAAGAAAIAYDHSASGVLGDSFVTLLDGPLFKLEGDPDKQAVPSGLSLIGLGNGQ